MKHALLVFACLTLSLFTFAQSNAFGNEVHIKITATKDTLYLSFKDKSFTLKSTNDLDSYLKKNIPEMANPDVDLETLIDITPEYYRAIIVIMDKYRFPVVSERSIPSGNGTVRWVKMATDNH
jgi:hypothetical protein